MVDTTSAPSGTNSDVSLLYSTLKLGSPRQCGLGVGQRRCGVIEEVWGRGVVWRFRTTLGNLLPRTNCVELSDTLLKNHNIFLFPLPTRRYFTSPTRAPAKLTMPILTRPFVRHVRYRKRRRARNAPLWGSTIPDRSRRRAVRPTADHCDAFHQVTN
jgi:hypothetical protein